MELHTATFLEKEVGEIKTWKVWLHFVGQILFQVEYVFT